METKTQIWHKEEVESFVNQVKQFLNQSIAVQQNAEMEILRIKEKMAE